MESYFVILRKHLVALLQAINEEFTICLYLSDDSRTAEEYAMILEAASKVSIAFFMDEHFMINKNLELRNRLFIESLCSQQAFGYLFAGCNSSGFKGIEDVSVPIRPFVQDQDDVLAQFATYLSTRKIAEAALNHTLPTVIKSDFYY